jgi:hypothetical protein
VRSGPWRWVGSLYVALACGCGPLGSVPDTAADDTVANASAGAASAPAEAGTSAGNADAGTGTARMIASNDLCERRTVQAQRIAPDMLIVLDRSLSMAPDANDTSTDRWDGSVAAINQMASAFEGTINFGLMTFPAFDSRQRLRTNSSATLEIQCPTGTLDVEPGPSRAVQIAEALEGLLPGGSTPTGPTLIAALDVLRAAAKLVAGMLAPRYVLLVTDGDPNCAGPPAFDGSDPLARRQALDAVEALADAQIKTYVVGFQTAGTSFADQLDEMAALGGTGETSHRSVESGADLAKTFQEVADRAVSCSFKLETAMVDPSYVLIETAGQPRPFQNQNGWTLGVDMKTVTLNGAACESVRSGASISVEVLCTPVVLL